MKLKVGTDFSGIGSPETALKRLNIPHENVFACDIDKYAKASYLELHDPGKFYDNITTRDHTKVERLDLYVAGFPCQAFSYAGKREGFADETRGTLFFDVAEFIRTNKPTCFILENVRGLVSHDKGRTFQTITDILSNGGGSLNGQVGLDTIDNGLGYHVYYKILNSKDFGVPQNRERIFIVGFRNYREFSFPKEMPLDKSLKDVLEDNVDEKFYLSKKMIDGFYKHKERHEKKGTGFKFEPKDGSGVANCLRANAALCPTDNTIIEKETKVITHSLYGRTSKNGNGGSGHLTREDGLSYCDDTGNFQAVELVMGAIRGRYKDDTDKKETEQRLELNSQEYTNTLTSVQKDNVVVQVNPSKESGGVQPYQQNRIYDIDGVSPALMANLGGDRSHNINTPRIRRLTPLECWRLQGFSDEDLRKAKKVCSNSQLYKQAGNSITVDVMVEIFKKIYLK
jgi:DNA (cytosine-5)-methyltransferase 1